MKRSWMLFTAVMAFATLNSVAWDSPHNGVVSSAHYLWNKGKMAYASYNMYDYIGGNYLYHFTIYGDNTNYTYGIPDRQDLKGAYEVMESVFHNYHKIYYMQLANSYSMRTGNQVYIQVLPY
jgi:hypothetical protein